MIPEAVSGCVPVAKDAVGLEQAVGEIRSDSGARFVLGGRSEGGRDDRGHVRGVDSDVRMCKRRFGGKKRKRELESCLPSFAERAAGEPSPSQLRKPTRLDS